MKRATTKALACRRFFEDEAARSCVGLHWISMVGATGFEPDLVGVILKADTTDVQKSR
jgi:hypothetical protein